jgi:hypothetical protein
MKLLLIIFGVGVTLGAYMLSRVVAKRHPSPFTTPVFFSTPLVILALLATGHPPGRLQAGQGRDGVSSRPSGRGAGPPAPQKLAHVGRKRAPSAFGLRWPGAWPWERFRTGRERHGPFMKESCKGRRRGRDGPGGRAHLARGPFCTFARLVKRSPVVSLQGPRRLKGLKSACPADSGCSRPCVEAFKADIGASGKDGKGEA